MQTANAYNAYKNNSITYASKEQLLLMLLDGAVRFSKIARQAIVDRDIAKANEYLIKTQNIFYELITSLDRDKAGNWGETMLSLYNFIIQQLTEANIKKDVDILNGVIPLIENIRDTWQQASKIASGKIANG